AMVWMPSLGANFGEHIPEPICVVRGTLQLRCFNFAFAKPRRSCTGFARKRRREPIHCLLRPNIFPAFRRSDTEETQHLIYLLCFIAKFTYPAEAKHRPHWN